MAGLTQTAWSDSIVNNRLVMQCTLTQALSTLYDSPTLKTPRRMLDPTKPWTLIVNSASATVGGGAVPVDIWAGYDDQFALTAGATDVTVSYGGEIVSAAMDDVNTEMLVTVVDPNYAGTKVQAATGTAGHVNAGTAPYYIINLDGGTNLAAEDCTIIIVQ